MPRSVILLHCDEPDGVMLSDSSGNLGDLAPDELSDPPASVSTFTGKGRRFEFPEQQSLVAADLPDGNTLLVRDMTIQAIVSLVSDLDVHVLIARGLRDGTASERFAYGIEFQQQALFPGFIEARWFWQDSTGALKVQPGGVWQHLGNQKLFLFTATRRWESSGKVVLRYYVGPDLIADLESTDGDIAGGTTGHTTLGGRKNAGVWEGAFNGVLDEMLVTDHEMSAEEVRHTWRRITEYQPAGIDMFAGLIPSGLAWYRDPGNFIGRHVRCAGEALGMAIAGTEELRAMHLPDAATLDNIPRWEKICGLTARPIDSLDVRRARVVGFLAREEGFALPRIRGALAEPLAIDADDIEILEYTNVVTDDFAALNTLKWSAYGDSVWDINAGRLRVTANLNDDLEWAINGIGQHIRMPLDRGDGDVHFYAKLVSYNLNDSMGSGMLLHNFLTGNTLWFGVVPDAGVARLGYRTVVDNVLGAFQVIATPAAASYWLRITPPGAVAGEWTLSRATASADGPFTHTTVALGGIGFDWAGFALFGDVPAAAGIGAMWDDAIVFCPRGLRPFSWQVYRDPMLAGSPDLGGADALVKRIKPAHTAATATTSKAGLDFSNPLGAW